MSQEGPPSTRDKLQLTLEEKLWFDKRKSDLQQYSAIGACVGGAVIGAITTLGPFSRRMRAAAITGGAMIGGGSGFLYADSKALARIEDLSAQSKLRKEYQQLLMEKKSTSKKE